MKIGTESPYSGLGGLGPRLFRNNFLENNFRNAVGNKKKRLGCPLLDTQAALDGCWLDQSSMKLKYSR